MRRAGWWAVLGAVVLMVVLGPVLAPYSPTAPVGPPFRPPSPEHLLGTDIVGRDVLSRLLCGGWSLLGTALPALVLAYAVGGGIGLIAGLRRRADPWLMRPVDAVMVLPWFLILAVIATALGPGTAAVLTTAVLGSAPWIARIVRTAVHDIADLPYLDDARMRGESLLRTALVEVLPNLRPIILADAGIRLSGVVSIVAVGGFLGFGQRPPDPDWALMITENRAGFGVQPWAVLAPALGVAVLVVSANMLGDRTVASGSRAGGILGRRTGVGFRGRWTAGRDGATAEGGDAVRIRRTGPAPTTGTSGENGTHGGAPPRSDAGARGRRGIGSDAGKRVRAEGLGVHTASGAVLLEGVTVGVGAGRGLAVVGASGAGKTTFAAALLGALPAGLGAAGEVELRVDDMGRRRVGFVPQDPSTGLNPALRIGTSIGEIARLYGTTDTTTEVEAALQRVGLPHDRAFRRRFPHQLSGGQQQRVLLAMAMLGDPALVVLDEPTTGLDARTRSGIVATLAELRRESDAALVIITHDLNGVAPLIDEVLELADGRMQTLKPLAAHLAPPAVDLSAELLSAGAATLDDVREPSATVGRRENAPVEQPSVALTVGGYDPGMRAAGDTAGAGTGSILRVRGLGLRYRSHHVAHGLSLDLEVGAGLAVTGRSGSGKTTLARALAGLHPASAGTLWLDEQALPLRLEARPAPQLRAIRLIAQNPATSLNPAHRVGAQLERPLRLLRGLDGAAAAAEAARLLISVGLDPALAARRPAALSGGQQQRVALARALAAEPSVLICDEITASLDAESRRIVVDLLAGLRRNGTALIVISHQEQVLAALTESELSLDAAPASCAGVPFVAPAAVTQP